MNANEFNIKRKENKMGFPTSVADEVLVRCSRRCCLCGEYVGQKIELHHIKQVADGGDDSVDNCIPLCFNCHAEVKAYNNLHPKGRKFTEKELKGHRDKCYARYSINLNGNKNTNKFDNMHKKIFEPNKNNLLVQWGYSELDKTCPLFLGNIVLVAGYTGSGKSAYLHHIINFNIKRGKKVVYCCLKDKPFNVALEFIAEDAHINVEYIKRGMITEEHWIKLTNNQNISNSKNLALIPYGEISNSNDILLLVENSGAEIIVIDDFNGISFDNCNLIENFFYQLKNVSAKKDVIVFVIYNLNIPSRLDKHPMLKDFPSDCYYRLFDIVQLLYRQNMFYIDDYEDQDNLEVIITKGALKNPHIIKI